MSRPAANPAANNKSLTTNDYTIMATKKYTVSISLYKRDSEQRYYYDETDMFDSKDDAYEELKRICESIERKEYEPERTIDFGYTTDDIVVDLIEKVKHDDDDTYEDSDILETKEFLLKAESLEGCALAVLVPQSTTQDKLVEVRMGYASDTTELLSAGPEHDLCRPYIKVIFDADEARRYKTVEELRQAVICELNEPFFRIINKHAIQPLVEQGVNDITI